MAAPFGYVLVLSALVSNRLEQGQRLPFWQSGWSSVDLMLSATMQFNLDGPGEHSFAKQWARTKQMRPPMPQNNNHEPFTKDCRLFPIVKWS